MAKVTNIASTVARVQNAQARGQRVQNAQATGGAGELGSGDRGGWSRVSPVSGNPYDQINYVERWRQLSQLYHTSWEAKKIVDIPVDDALRKDWIVEGLDEKHAKPIQNEFTRLKVLHELERELKMERLFGGCLGFLGLEGDKDEPAEPYKADSGEMLRFINTIPVSRISRTYWEQDPLAENYMRPRAYLVNGQEIHASRLLIFDGNPLFNVLDYQLSYPNKVNLTGFGPSVLYTIWDDIMRAIGVRQASYQLTLVNGALIAAVSDLQDLAGTAPGKATLQRIKDIANQLSVYRAAMIADEKVSISQHSASFGSVPELLMMYLQVLAAASDIPARRFIGDGVMGLGSTDENALENYYNNIDSYQRRRIEPILRRLYDIIGYRIHGRAWRDMRKDLVFKFPPLFNERESVTCVTKAQYMTNVQTALDLNILDDDEAIEEINQKEIFGVTVRKKVIEREEDLTGEPVDPQAEIDRLRQGGASSGPPGAKAAPGGSEPRGINPEGIEKERRIQNSVATWIQEMIEAAGYDPAVFIPSQFLKGYAVEQEHADVTGGDPVAVAKIVLAHLTERADYYDRLERIENASFVTHYFNPKTRKLACSQGVGISMKGAGSARLWTEDKTQVTCTRCQSQLEKWAASEAKKTQNSYFPRTHRQWHGLDGLVETDAGQKRKGRCKQTGRIWTVTMPVPYGELSCATGVDGDGVDCYWVGDEPVAHLIEQLDPPGGPFDEHKLMLGAATEEEAIKVYCASFSDGKGFERIGKITEMSVDELKAWLAGPTHIKGA